MIGIPNFDVTNQTGKQKFVDYIINLMRNEIISFTSSYNDNDNAASSGVLPNGLVPAGTIVMYGGTVLPDGYLWCDGTQQLIASYTSLFIALGVSRYGVDTATQFYLPNLTSHLPRGAATTGGAVTTNNNNTPNHTVNATTATAAAPNTNSDGNHNHSISAAAATAGGGGHGHNNNGANTGGPTGNINRGATGTLSAVATSGHTHGVNGASTSSNAEHNHTVNATANTNSDGAHNHSLSAGAITVTSGTINNAVYVPAFVEVNYIIKT